MLAVPMLTALVLGVVRTSVDLERAAEFQQTVDQVDLAGRVTRLVHELQRERTLAVVWVSGGRSSSRTELDTQLARVDQVVAATREAAAALGTDDVLAARRYRIELQRLSALEAIRATSVQTRYPDAALFGAYSAVLDALVRLVREINTTATGDLLRFGTVVQAISEAKENVSKENAILHIAALHGAFPADLGGRIRDAQAGAAGALGNYRAYATAGQLRLYSDTVSGPAVDNRERIKHAALASAALSTPENPVALTIDSTALLRDGAQTVERLRTVEAALLDTLREDADRLAAQATDAAWRGAGIVLAALLVAFALGLWVTNLLLGPLRTLQKNALRVAYVLLPRTVQRILADPDPVAAAEHAVDPVPVFSREEIGEVARSFDAVHGQAVKLATEQAVLRDNINKIFVNLARRSQTLVQRQLGLLDRMEQNEQDPDQLAHLFELDHLATRMRRNSESLLVLSGTPMSTQLTQPLPAVDVVNAAVGEVEQYQRITVDPVPDTAVQGRAVHDVVHLLAELLDNATRFSRPDQIVRVRTKVTPHGELRIHITDSGVGLSDEDIAAANERLAHPADLDVNVTKLMGLYVVARLATKHNITVHLHQNDDIDEGIVAKVTVPAELVTRPRHRHPSPGGPTGPGSGQRIASSRHPGGPQPGLLTPSAAGQARRRHRPTEIDPQIDPYRPLDHRQVGEPPASTDLTPGPAVPSVPAPSAAYPRADTTNGIDGRDASCDIGAVGDVDVIGAAVVADPAELGGLAIGGVAGGGAESETERLPIYEAVLSRWFSPEETDSAPDSGGQLPSPDANWPAGSPSSAVSRDAPQPAGWVSSGDEGWRAARELLDVPQEATTTAVGLPKRVPKRRLIPGSATSHPDAPHSDTRRPENGDRAERPSAARRDPNRLRDRLSSFQNGVQRGRNALETATKPGHNAHRRPDPKET